MSPKSQYCASKCCCHYSSIKYAGFPKIYLVSKSLKFGESVIVLYFVVRYFMFIIVLQSS